jgi:hypothetical protein
MRWPWQDPEDSPKTGHAALERAREDLDADRERGTEVRREVVRAHRLRRKNHFGEAMIELMRSVRT